MVLAIYGACFPSQLPFQQQQSMIGTVNFLKSAEGYFEAYPQATYQISIAMRDQWPPSKI